MPLCLVKAASTSSSAFFIDAAAKTVMDLSCAWAASGTAAMAIAAAKAARMAFLVSTTVLQQLSARQLCAPDQHMIRESRYDRLGEPSFQAFTARAQRTVGRGRTIGRRPWADKRRCCAQVVTLPPGAMLSFRAGARAYDRGRADRRRIRLHHRRRRLGRLHSRQSALRRRRQARAHSRSRRPRQLDLVSHSGRLSVRHRQSALRLVFQDRARSRASTAAASIIRAAR